VLARRVPGAPDEALSVEFGRDGAVRRPRD